MDKTLHCIGDSHVAFFTGKNKIGKAYPDVEKSIVPNIFTYRLGSPLAYNLGNDNNTTQSKEKLRDILTNLNTTKDIVLLSFGEVDCRAHAIRQAEAQHKSMEEIVDLIVERYFRECQKIKSQGFELIIWNAVPTAEGLEGIDFEYPYHGTMAQRNAATKYFNQQLSNKAKKAGIMFLNFFDELSNKDGGTKSKFYFDKIHLNNLMFTNVIEKINERFPFFGVPFFVKMKLNTKKIFSRWV